MGAARVRAGHRRLLRSASRGKDNPRLTRPRSRPQCTPCACTLPRRHEDRRTSRAKQHDRIHSPRRSWLGRVQSLRQTLRGRLSTSLSAPRLRPSCFRLGSFSPMRQGVACRVHKAMTTAHLALDRVANHQRRHRSVGHPPPGEAGRDIEIAFVSCTPDVGRWWTLRLSCVDQRNIVSATEKCSPINRSRAA